MTKTDFKFHTYKIQSCNHLSEVCRFGHMFYIDVYSWKIAVHMGLLGFYSGSEVNKM